MPIDRWWSIACLFTHWYGHRFIDTDQLHVYVYDMNTSRLMTNLWTWYECQLRDVDRLHSEWERLELEVSCYQWLCSLKEKVHRHLGVICAFFWQFRKWMLCFHFCALTHLFNFLSPLSLSLVPHPHMPILGEWIEVIVILHLHTLHELRFTDAVCVCVCVCVCFCYSHFDPSPSTSHLTSSDSPPPIPPHTLLPHISSLTPPPLTLIPHTFTPTPYPSQLYTHTWSTGVLARCRRPNTPLPWDDRCCPPSRESPSLLMVRVRSTERK